MTTILVIDDEPNFVSLVEAVLSRYGYELLSANNGIEGITIAESQQPDVILLDVLMPMIGGMKILRHLKTSEKAAHIPIIVVTAAGGETIENLEGMEEFGPDDVVAKPFLPDALLESINKLLDTDSA